MGFFIFMAIMVAMIPALMIVFGLYFIKKQPTKINYLFGYKTARSMKNSDTWKFAHRHFGRIWLMFGAFILPLSMIILFLFIGKDKDTVGTVGSIITLSQCFLLCLSIFPTESALKKAFDKNGNKILFSSGDHCFRRITDSEIPVMFDMILERMKWMDEVGIEQWNKTEYDKVYPISYFKDHADSGRVFVLINRRSGRISAAAVFKDEDDRWKFPAEKHTDYLYPDSALYLHNFVSDTADKGAGKTFMKLSEKHLYESGIKFFRLDSALGNEKLEKYYADMGFIPVGTCVDGQYVGVLRQKELL